jgi:hypothetical protein
MELLVTYKLINIQEAIPSITSDCVLPVVRCVEFLPARRLDTWKQLTSLRSRSGSVSLPVERAWAMKRIRCQDLLSVDQTLSYSSSSLISALAVTQRWIHWMVLELWSNRPCKRGIDRRLDTADTAPKEDFLDPFLWNFRQWLSLLH